MDSIPCVGPSALYGPGTPYSSRYPYSPRDFGAQITQFAHQNRAEKAETVGARTGLGEMAGILGPLHQ